MILGARGAWSLHSPGRLLAMRLPFLNSPALSARLEKQTTRHGVEMQCERNKGERKVR